MLLPWVCLKFEEKLSYKLIVSLPPGYRLGGIAEIIETQLPVMNACVSAGYIRMHSSLLSRYMIAEGAPRTAVYETIHRPYLLSHYTF